MRSLMQKEQLLLFDREEEMINYIEAEKILATDAVNQLTSLAFSLIKLSKELLTENKPLFVHKSNQQHYTR